MAARKKKTRHGATQPEDERARKGVLLRLSLAELTELDTFATTAGLPRSRAVVVAVRWAVRDEVLKLAHVGADGAIRYEAKAPKGKER